MESDDGSEARGRVSGVEPILVDTGTLPTTMMARLPSPGKFPRAWFERKNISE